MMLVHSFSVTDASLDDLVQFAAAMGMPAAGRNAASEPRTIGDVELRLAWVGDTPSR